MIRRNTAAIAFIGSVLMTGVLSFALGAMHEDKKDEVATMLAIAEVTEQFCNEPGLSERVGLIFESAGVDIAPYYQPQSEHGALREKLTVAVLSDAMSGALPLCDRVKRDKRQDRLSELKE